jgi:hypothetical protein
MQLAAAHSLAILGVEPYVRRLRNSAAISLTVMSTSAAFI